MKKAHLSQDTEHAIEINMSPLIDCVFLLLIFFVVTTVFVEETGVEVQKPKAASATDLERNAILIALTAEGHIVYGGRTLDLNSLRGLVSGLVREQERPVIIMADASARTDQLVDVIDECKLGGARNVSLATNREPR